MREAANVDDVIEAHLYNMKQCGTCYARYRSLTEALEARGE